MWTISVNVHYFFPLPSYTHLPPRTHTLCLACTAAYMCFCGSKPTIAVLLPSPAPPPPPTLTHYYNILNLFVLHLLPLPFAAACVPCLPLLPLYYYHTH